MSKNSVHDRKITGPRAAIQRPPWRSHAVVCKSMKSKTHRVQVCNCRELHHNYRELHTPPDKETPLVGDIIAHTLLLQIAFDCEKKAVSCIATKVIVRLGEWRRRQLNNLLDNFCRLSLELLSAITRSVICLCFDENVFKIFRRHLERFLLS